MKRYTILLSSVVLLLALVLPSFAQEVVQLEWLDVRLWPEYDSPQLLVILEGEPSQPHQTVLLPLPAGASVHAVATTTDDGSLVDNTWEQITSPEGVDLISITPKGPQFHLEYYAPLPTDGARRTIDFVLPANYVSAGNAAVEIVLPPTAAEVVADPSAAPSDDPASAEHVLLRKVGALNGDQDLSQSVSYSNPSGALTTSNQPPQAETAPPSVENAPAAAVSTETTSNNNLVLFGLAGLAVLLIAGGAFGLWWSSRRSEDALPPDAGKPTGRAKSKRPKKQQQGGATGRDRFCRRCGAEFASGDLFCRKCGEKRL